jgi:transcriptional regulator with XRE-family HTH domain
MLYSSNIKSLRLRLGWSQAELARRLNCSSAEIEEFESGFKTPDKEKMGQLVLLLSHADATSFEMQSTPKAENFCERRHLGQIDIYCIDDNEL